MSNNIDHLLNATLYRFGQQATPPQQQRHLLQPQQRHLLQQQQQQQQKRPERNVIDYDGILRNMGMYSDNGILRFQHEMNSTTASVKTVELPTTSNARPNTYNVHATPKVSTMNMPHSNSKTPHLQQLQQQLYQQRQQQQDNGIPRQPRSIREYRIMLYQQWLERKRIQQIKPKQMFFHRS